MAKAELRIKSVGTKVTEAEYGRLEAAARARGQTLAEWVREVLLENVNQPSATPAEETLLAEVLGLRTILLNLFYKLAKGEAGRAYVPQFGMYAQQGILATSTNAGKERPHTSQAARHLRTAVQLLMATTITRPPRL